MILSILFFDEGTETEEGIWVGGLGMEIIRLTLVYPRWCGGKTEKEGRRGPTCPPG